MKNTLEKGIKIIVENLPTSQEKIKTKQKCVVWVETTNKLTGSKAGKKYGWKTNSVFEISEAKKLKEELSKKYDKVEIIAI